MSQGRLGKAADEALKAKLTAILAQAEEYACAEAVKFAEQEWKAAGSDPSSNGRAIFNWACDERYKQAYDEKLRGLLEEHGYDPDEILEDKRVQSSER